MEDLFKTNPVYKEILKLKQMLEDAEIPFECNEQFGGWRIAYPNDIHTQLSAIENMGSSGSLNDRIEVWNFEDDPMGYLTAEEVFAMIQKLDSGMQNF